MPAPQPDEPLPDEPLPDEPLRDERWRADLITEEVVFTGRIFDVRRESFALGDAGVLTRDWVQHSGAVAILALDPDDRVLFIQQYRHPAGVREWELPAGLLDVPGEAPVDGARRELAEEADLIAGEWHVLADHLSSPGFTNEALRTFLARDLSTVAETDRYSRAEEELDMPTRWVPLDEALEAVLRGDLHNPSTVIGILAAHASRARGWSTLRPSDAPWPERPAGRSAAH